jgi:hypothetical protein
MVRITDDSGTVTKCLLDPYDAELGELDAPPGRSTGSASSRFN